MLGAVLAIAALAMGCGGNGDGSSSSASATAGSSESSAIATTQLSKRQFHTQAGALCQHAAEKALESSGTNEPQVIATVLVPELRSAAEKIRALGAPSGDEAGVEAFLAALLENTESIAQQRPTSFEGAEKLLASSSLLASENEITGCIFTTGA